MTVYQCTKNIMIAIVNNKPEAEIEKLLQELQVELKKL